VTVQNNGNDVALIVTLTSGSGKVTFIGTNHGDVRYQPDKISLADGTVWTWATMPR
jgi:hypothetical protein